MDWETERIIPLRDVPKYVPSRVSGKKISPSTVFRWALRRTNPLETFRTPGGRFTSVEAIGRFLNRCTVAASNHASNAASPDADGAGHVPAEPAGGPASERALRAGAQLANLIGPTPPRDRA